MDTAILSAEMKFAHESFPRCLHHYTNDEALRNAIQLTEFLQAAVSSIIGSGWDMSESEVMGLDHCFNLLRDKIEIGAGLYNFPQVGYSPSPKLCDRKEV